MCLLFVFVLLTLTFSSIRDLASSWFASKNKRNLFCKSYHPDSYTYMYVAEIWVEDGNLVHSGPKQNHEVLELGP